MARLIASVLFLLTILTPASALIKGLRIRSSKDSEISGFNTSNVAFNFTTHGGHISEIAGTNSIVVSEGVFEELNGQWRNVTDTGLVAPATTEDTSKRSNWRMSRSNAVIEQVGPDLSTRFVVTLGQAVGHGLLRAILQSLTQAIQDFISDHLNHNLMATLQHPIVFPVSSSEGGQWYVQFENWNGSLTFLDIQTIMEDLFDMLYAGNRNCLAEKFEIYHDGAVVGQGRLVSGSLGD